MSLESHQSDKRQPDVTLHTYFRSSCSARIRIALNLKGIRYESKYINVLKGEQSSPEYKAINPSGVVPTITFTDSSLGQNGENDGTFALTQSMAILEYLEDAFPSPQFSSLLPSSLEDRARVRQLCSIIASDIQPPTNLKILKRIKAMATEAKKDPETAGKEWQSSLMAEGLSAYETILKKTAGNYSVGDEITMADCCLMPAIDGAERFGVDVMGSYENIARVRRNLDKVEAVKKGGWRWQEDTPDEFRVKE